jgi:rhodanese-related sulfurtransferase
MLTLARRKCFVGVFLILVALVVTSCAPAATPIPTALLPTQPPATPTPTAIAMPTKEVVATPTSILAPTEAPTATPAPEVVGTPTSPDEMPRISLEELKALMDSGANVVILDDRPRESYQLGHIKGAISFPWKPQLTIGDLEMLPMGKMIVTYCDCGPGEADSASVAFQLIELGVEGDVKVLAHPSIEGWIEAGYPTG